MARGTSGLRETEGGGEAARFLGLGERERDMDLEREEPEEERDSERPLRTRLGDTLRDLERELDGERRSLTGERERERLRGGETERLGEACRLCLE